MKLPLLEDLPPVDGKRVLVRTDFNVPLDGEEIVDDFRIRAALPTLQWLQEQGASVVACRFCSSRWTRVLLSPAC